MQPNREEVARTRDFWLTKNESKETQMEIFVGLLVVWVLFGIACAVIATNKGRSGGGWFVLGFLLGPFALILALVVSKNQESIDNKNLQSGEMKRCPYCAEMIKMAAIKCRFCGEDLPENQPSDLSDTPTEESADMQQETPVQWGTKEEAREGKIIGIIAAGLVFCFVIVSIAISQC